MLTKGETFSIACYTGKIFRAWDILRKIIFCMEIEYPTIIFHIEVRDRKGTRTGNDSASGKCPQCFRIDCKKVCINGKHSGLGQFPKLVCLIFFKNTWRLYSVVHSINQDHSDRSLWQYMLAQCFRYFTFIGRV